MRYAKPILSFLAFFIAAFIIISLVAPTKQRVTRSITIDASPAFVFSQLKSLDNFMHWSVWTKSDSTARYVISGIDGTPGAKTSWTGDPATSGKGEITLELADSNSHIRHRIHFISPHDRIATSDFLLRSYGQSTTVTWTFEMSTPRPWNIFNLFSSLSKGMGDSFDEGLLELKKITEKAAGKPEQKTYVVNQGNFPAMRFAAIRQIVSWNDLNAFFEQHLPIIYEGTAHARLAAGAPTGIFYSWNDTLQQTDVAVGVAIDGKGEVAHQPVVTLDFPASKAVYVDYHNDARHDPVAYASLEKYIREKNLTPKTPSFEFYILGPSNEPDSGKWVTRVMVLVE